MKYVALCTNTVEYIWASGDTIEEAKALLWEKVHEFLVDRQAPETMYFDAERLEEYFGCWVINTSRRFGRYGTDDTEDF